MSRCRMGVDAGRGDGESGHALDRDRRRRRRRGRCAAGGRAGEATAATPDGHCRGRPWCERKSCRWVVRDRQQWDGEVGADGCAACGEGVVEAVGRGQGLQDPGAGAEGAAGCHRCGGQAAQAPEWEDPVPCVCASARLAGRLEARGSRRGPRRWSRRRCRTRGQRPGRPPQQLQQPQQPRPTPPRPTPSPSRPTPACTRPRRARTTGCSSPTPTTRRIGRRSRVVRCGCMAAAVTGGVISIRMPTERRVLHHALARRGEDR